MNEFPYKEIRDGRLWECCKTGYRRSGTALCDEHEALRDIDHEAYHKRMRAFDELKARQAYHWTYGFNSNIDAGHQFWCLDLYRTFDISGYSRLCPRPAAEPEIVAVADSVSIGIDEDEDAGAYSYTDEESAREKAEVKFNFQSYTDLDVRRCPYVQLNEWGKSNHSFTLRFAYY